MKRWKKISLWIVSSLVLLVCGIVLFSPFGHHPGFPYKLVRTTVDIDAPPDEVFRYLGNSAHAHDWSVFVDHITPLNANEVKDGTPGARRRCFRTSEEKGIQWDELITEVVPNQKRQLTMYNLHGFPMQAEDLATEQRYEPLDGGKRTRLTFTLFFYHNQPSLIDQAKTYFAAYTVHSIFSQNMHNIKRIVEQEHAAAQHQ